MIPQNNLGIPLPLPPHSGAALLARALGNVKSGNYGHAGRPGKVGGSAPDMVALLSKRLVHTTDPEQTKFLLPDGTRLATPLSHEAALRELGLDWDQLDADQDQGIARYLRWEGNVSTRVPLTEVQARTIADDWNHVFKMTLTLDYGHGWLDALGNQPQAAGFAKSFDRPFTAERLLAWSRNNATRTLARGNFGHAGRPGRVGGSASAHFVKATEAQRHALVLPPAWTDVRVNPDPDGELLAVGRDAKGRLQYRYSAAHSKGASAEKFARLKAFNDAYPAIAKQIAADAPHNEAAAALLLIAKTGFRIGSDHDTQAEKKAYGATTLKATQVTVRGDRLDFHFIGKKGVKIHRVIEDSALASLIRPRDAAGGRLFDTSDSQVRTYLRTLTPDFTPKDFRTRIGTAEALRVVQAMPVPRTASAFKYARKAVGMEVAKVLGNQPSEALKSYIDPKVFQRWQVRPVLRAAARGNWGHAGRLGKVGGSGPKQILDEVKKRLNATDLPSNTAFILPDGTRLSKPSGQTHTEALGGTHTRKLGAGWEEFKPLFDAMNAGIIRYFPGQGIQLTRTPTEAQARTIADDWSSDAFNHASLNIDLSPKIPGEVYVSKKFEWGRITHDAIRNWVAAANFEDIAL